MKSLFEEMGGIYRQVGDYFIPNLILPDDSDYQIGKYGRLRRNYLKEHRKILYTNYVVEGTLFKHLSEIDQACNERMEIIKQCEAWRDRLMDFSTLDADIERQLEETQVVAELVKAAVRENASTAQSQEAYLKKYEALTKRYEKAAAELERLQSLRTLRSQRDKKMALYIRTLKKQPEVMHDWNDTIWTVMVEKAIVHKDGSITFRFYSGAEIKAGA